MLNSSVKLDIMVLVQLRNQRIMTNYNKGKFSFQLLSDFSVLRTGEKQCKMETQIHQSSLVCHHMGHLPFDEKLCLNFQKFLVMIVTIFWKFIPREEGNLSRYTQIFQNFLFRISFSFDSPPRIFKWYHFRVVAFFENSTVLLFCGQFSRETGVPPQYHLSPFVTI